MYVPRFNRIVIPRIQYVERAAHRERGIRSAFSTDGEERRLHIFVDVESLSSGSLATEMIHGYDGHPLILCETIGAGGTRTLTVGAVAEDSDNASIGVGGESVGTAWVRSASQKRELAEQYARDKSEAGIRALTDRLLLASHAELHGSDAYVTASDDLIRVARKGFFAGANIMTPEEALALIGLYLRLRGDFGHHHSGGSRVTFGRSGFYRGLACSLLPESERWFACCPSHVNPWDVAPRDLAEAVVTRIERALRARDRLHQALLVERTPEANDEALFYFDMFLVSLAGAFDAIARVAHKAYGMNGSIFDANWRKEHRRRKPETLFLAFVRGVLGWLAPTTVSRPRTTWMQRLGESAPTVAQLMFPHEPTRDALEAVVQLRNSIHAEALSTIGFHDTGSSHTEYPVVVPPAARRELVGVVRRRGGDGAWGIRELDREAFVLDVATYVECALEHAVSGVNKLMRAVAVERLGCSPAARLPGWTGPSDVALQRIRLLSGLAG